MVMLTTGDTVMQPETVVDPPVIVAMQRVAREVPVVPSVRAFALAMVRGSRPGQGDAIAEVEGVVRLGASPRAAQALMLAAKVSALAHGRRHVTQQDVVDVAEPVMNHRLLLDHRVFNQEGPQRRVMRALVAHAREHARPRLSRWIGEILRNVSR
jgi:MoxR-like ATPase